MSEPKFIPKPGQVDYTNIRYCPTINCIIKCNDEFLLLKRSPDLNLYPGLWNGVSGFLDDHQDIQDKVREELKEELNILEDKISSIKVFNPFYIEGKEYDKTWIVFPVLVEINSKDLKIDFEHSEYKWFKIDEYQNIAKSYKIISDIPIILNIVFSNKQL